MNNLPTAKHGYLLAETLLGIALLGIIVASLVPSLGFLLQRSRTSVVSADATSVLQEGMEIAYNVALSDWETLTPGSYIPVLDTLSSPPQWKLIPTATAETVQAKYERLITVTPVLRDPSTGNRGGTQLDTNGKVVTTVVNWLHRGNPEELKAELLITKVGSL